MPRRVSSGKVGRAVLGDIFTQDNSIRSIETNANLVLQPNGTGVVETAADIQTNAQAGIRFADSDSSNYVKLVSPATVASNLTLSLPSADGSANQTLITDGSGNLSFADAGLAVTNRTAADPTDYYLAMIDQTSGNEGTLSVVDGTRLTYNPQNALLQTGRISLSSSTASSSTSTGALVVTGGVGVGGQLTATTLVETSSITYKENIIPITNGLDTVLKLQGVFYNRKDTIDKLEIGLIAEEVAPIAPEVVSYQDGKPEGISYTKLTAYLIEAIKDLQNELQKVKNNG